MRAEKLSAVILLGAALVGAAHGDVAPRTAGLSLEATIALPDVSGRIDHLAVDVAGKRLFVAELGNGSVEIIDLQTRKVIHRLAGLHEPQGVAYLPDSRLIAVSSAGDGTVQFFDGASYAPRGVVALGEDADNMRVDPRNGTLVVGYGNGALAVIDPASLKRTGTIALPAHPEAFQIAPLTSRVFVNVPDAHEVTVVDAAAGAAIWHWKTQGLSENFPMALDEPGHTLAVAFRSPARLVLFDAVSGNRRAEIATRGDADDVYFDAKRQHYYVSCGEGFIDVFEYSATGLKKLTSVATTSGARTSLFVPELDRLFVAQRAGWFWSPAGVQIYRPDD